MKILHILPSLRGGGAERVVLDLAKCLGPYGFNCALAAFRAEGEYKDSLPENLEYFDLKAQLGLRRMRTLVKILQGVFDEYKPDVVHCHLTNANRNIIRAMKAIPNRPKLVVSEHNNLNQNLLRFRNPLKRRLVLAEIRSLYSKVDRLVGVSAGVSESIAKIVRPVVAIETLYNPVDFQKVLALKQQPSGFSVSNSTRNLVAVGRLVPQKGFEDLIRSFAMIAEKENLSLNILGEGPERGALEGLIEELELSDRVTMPGFLENPWRVILDSDIYVSASLWEGQQIALIEAILCEIPVVSTDCDFGPREVIESEKNGLLVPVGDNTALADAVTRLLNSEELREEYRRRALDSINRFRFEEVGKAYRDFYQSLF